MQGRLAKKFDISFCPMIFLYFSSFSLRLPNKEDEDGLIEEAHVPFSGLRPSFVD